jgi:hypothetical protein
MATEASSADLVTPALRRWFVVHFAADMLFAVPLFVAPTAFLELVGWRSVDPYTARIAAAALFGVGIESWLGRNAGPESFVAMLNLKVIWSFACTLGIAISLVQDAQGKPLAAWGFLATFGCFHALWVVHRVRLGQRLRARPEHTTG